MEPISMQTYGHGPRKVIGIHGWFGDDRTFARIEESLDPADFECAWLSLRGVGGSRAVAGNYAIAEIAQDALEAAQHLGWETYSVIGHSMGGKAAMLSAALDPDRVERVIGIAPVSARAQTFPLQAWRTLDAASHDIAQRREVIASSIGGAVSKVWVERLATASAAQADPEVTRAYLHSWARDDVSASVRGCATPTLGIVGGNDPTITEESVTAEYAELLEHWQVVQVAGAGHYVHDEAPLLVGTLVDRFLRDADGKAASAA